MITRAIIEELVSSTEVKVRIPKLHAVESNNNSTSIDDLPIATVCTLPNCYTNMNVGDIVFVGFEDSTFNKVVVLGHLCREAVYPSYADINLFNVDIKNSAKLPVETCIGDVLSNEIKCLQGLKDNIQNQLDDIQQQILNLKETIESSNNS